MNSQLGRVVAERVLEVARTRRRLTVRLGTPRKDRGDWFCPYQLSGLGRRAVRGAYGSDSFQALTLALKAIRAELATIDEPLMWIGGQRGDSGFALIVDTTFIGPAALKRIEKMAEREVLDFFAREIAARKKRKLAKRRL